MATPEEQLQTMLNNLPEKTGKPLDEWIKIVGATGHEKHGQIVKFLKSDHGVTHGFANLISNRYLGGGTSSEQDMLGDQYSGPKADLRPIYDSVEAFVKTLGSDAEISIKKTMVSFRRKKQFALIQPSTRTRVDLGINLKGMEPEGKLEASGSFNAMVSHRVRLSAPEDFDESTKAWLLKAYEAAG
jgi:hypothetical protein